MPPVSKYKALLMAALITGALSACGGQGGNAPAGMPSIPQSTRDLFSRPHTPSGKIKHVVIIVQENRSFDNLFQGFPGADTHSYGYTSNGTKVNLQQIPLETTWDIDHSSGAFFSACNGTGTYPGTDCRMNGFDQEYAGCNSYCPSYPQYAYVPHKETAPLFAIAHEFVLADRMFASNFDASSFISHQYIIAGQADKSFNYPSGQWGCDGGSTDEIGYLNHDRQWAGYHQACFDYTTLGDELDTAGLSWNFFTASLYGDGNLWSAYQAVSHIRYGADWAKVITPQTEFYTYIQKNELPAVSWVTPTCENSDHAGCGDNTGPAWVASLVNAVGESKYWDSTAIFIMWDDYGGWYDHVPPPHLDYDGLGLRIPLMVVSAYAKKDYVSHVQYEHGSILRFIEDQFGLPQMTAADRRANSPELDCFNFTKAPRAFVPIPSVMTKADFMRQPPDKRPPDDE